MTLQELIDTYNSFSDEQLLEAHHNLRDYTDEAKVALALVIKNRGDIEKLLANERLQSDLSLETGRIKQQVRRLGTPKVDLEFLNKMIESTILSESQRRSIIKEAFEEILQELEDKKIKLRTLLGGGVAAGIASLMGGVLWGLQLMWSGRVFGIFLIGLVLLCYGLIRLFTKQSHRNIVVIILTAISVVIGLVIGQLMFATFGRQ